MKIVRRLTAPLVILALSLSLMGATCQHGTPRHDTRLNLEMLTSTLKGLQAGEKALYDAHTVPALTLERHKSFNSKMVQVWDANEAAVIVAQAWRPGKPLPPQLGILLGKVSALMTEVADVIGVALPAKVAHVWDAVVKVLVIVGGGVIA
jgi:hypothetical protein